jgi:hypothetical protein
MIDEPYEFYQRFKLNSQKFNDFEQDDDNEDFIYLFGLSMRNNISKNISTFGISWNGDWNISVSTTSVDELNEVRDFLKYIEENKILNCLIQHYIEFNRLSAIKKFDEVCQEYKLNQKIKNDYQELNKELTRYGTANSVNKKNKI